MPAFDVAQDRRHVGGQAREEAAAGGGREAAGGGGEDVMRYTGDAGECVKCGRRGAATRFVRGENVREWRLDRAAGLIPRDEMPPVPDERMARTCLNCGYTWVETPRDWLPDTGEAAL